MSLTGTIHPPGGATAVLASTQAAVIKMGWKYIPLVLMDSTLMVCVALIFNNVLRQYPVYWWTPNSVGRKLRQERRKAKQGKDVDEGSVEKGPQKAASDATRYVFGTRCSTELHILTSRTANARYAKKSRTISTTLKALTPYISALTRSSYHSISSSAKMNCD